MSAVQLEYSDVDKKSFNYEHIIGFIRKGLLLIVIKLIQFVLNLKYFFNLKRGITLNMILKLKATNQQIK